MSDVVLIDAGTGNLRSVQKALESVGSQVLRTDDPNRVLTARRVVLPGVGAFGEFMSGLKRRGIDDTVKEIVDRSIPLLGVCVGMQALFDVGEELGSYAGLGLLPGKVTRFANFLSVKVPHTGWNQLETRQGATLFRDVPSGAYVYFNHPYYCQPEDRSDITATTAYGCSYASSVQHNNIFGVQFHPEKSQRVGLQILKNFVEIA